MLQDQSWSSLFAKYMDLNFADENVTALTEKCEDTEGEP